MHGELSDGNEFYLDQVTLALLASDYKIRELSEEYNYPINLRLKIPKRTKIIHYKESLSLYRGLILSPNIRNNLRSIDMTETYNLNLKTSLLAAKDVYNALYFNRKDRISLKNYTAHQLGLILDSFGAKQKVKDLLNIKS